MADLEEVIVNGKTPQDPGSFNLDAFRNQDMVRSCKFFTWFDRIPAIIEEHLDSIVRLPQLTDSVEFPGKNLLTDEIRMAGRQKIKVPVARDFNEVTLSMYYSTDVPVYRFFSDWIESMSPTSTSNEYYDNCVGRIRIEQYSDMAPFRVGKSAYATPLDKVLQVILHNCYPTSIAPMPCNWSDDGFQKVSVTFYYEYSITETLFEVQPSSSKDYLKNLNPITTRVGDLLSQTPNINLG